MGLKLVDLLRWSKEVPLLDSSGEPLKRGNKEIKVWLRIIGDQDLEDSYKAARAASRRQRTILKDRDSDDFVSGIGVMMEATQDECKLIIVNGSLRDFNAQAYANVERPELPKIEEIAVDPDAPTLEEQEKLDELIDKVNKEYLENLDQYVETKKTETESELEALSLDEIRERAIEALINIQALEVFIKELDIQKVYRATYTDETFKERAFDSVEEFRQFKLKDYLIQEYGTLELNPEDVKN